jgi:protein SSD1
LSSLQRVIADLKTTSPPNLISPPNNSLAASMHAPHLSSTNLPANAPIFQPGASAFPGHNLPEAVRHRKAASLGASALSGNYNSYSPHLRATIEDAEDVAYEDGEISDSYYQTPGHQVRSQSQSFMAPRFAALAAQQEQDMLGPTGRPQLAPNFMFGAHRRTSSNLPMGPLNEEDVGFQFPQQQNPEGVMHDQNQKRPGDDITGIMAEQVCVVSLAFDTYPDLCGLDRYPESDRGSPAAAAGTLSTAVGLQSGAFPPNSRPCTKSTQTRPEHPAYGRWDGKRQSECR